MARWFSVNAVEGDPSLVLVLTALKLSGPTTLTRQKASVNAVFQRKTNEHALRTPISLDNISKILSRAREPPITNKETDNREGRKVGQPPPIRRLSVQQQAPVIANQRRERIQINEPAIA